MQLLKKGRQIIAILSTLAPIAELNHLGGFQPGVLRCQFSAPSGEDTRRDIIRFLTSSLWLVVTRCLHPLTVSAKWWLPDIGAWLGTQADQLRLVNRGTER